MSSRSVVSAFAVLRCTDDRSPRNRRHSVQRWPQALHLVPLHDNTANTALDDRDEFSIEVKDHKGGNITAVAKSTKGFQFSIGIPPDAILLLNLVAILWGSQHAVIKMCVSDVDPSSLSFVRFFLGALLATPAWWYSSRTTVASAKGNAGSKASASDLSMTWRWGFEMGFWMFLGYAFQSIGLAYTTALRSGFLLYLNVKLVPFFAFVLLGRKISVPTWVSAMTALTGTSLLAYDGTSLGFNVGDVWSIAAAAASAMFILRLEVATAAVPNSAALNASCLWVVAIASAFWSASLGLLSMDSVYTTLSSHPLELFYLSAVTTALANWIQTKAQQNVSAERASVIYAMDPVWGALWANVLLGETLTGFGILGASLITAAAATNAFLDLGNSESSSLLK